MAQLHMVHTSNGAVPCSKYQFATGQRATWLYEVKRSVYLGLSISGMATAVHKS